VDESQSPISKRTELVEQLAHRLAKSRQVAGPTISCVNGSDSGIKVVKYLFVIAFALCEFTVVVTHGIVKVTHDVSFDGAVGIKENFSVSPRASDEVIKTMPRQEKESMIAAGGVKGFQRGGGWGRDINGRN
jgi:hypothetical protein